MKTIEMILREEKQKLEQIIEETKKRLKVAPKGRLRIRNWNGVVEYYYNEEKARTVNESVDKHNNANGRYLKKSEKKIAVGIAQRDYDMQLEKTAQERLKAINIFLNKYEKNSLKTLYQKINPCRRVLIEAPEISDEEYIKRWQTVEYKGKQFAEDGPEIITEKGERVRSKSEKIIADKLYVLGIPYRYEYPVILEGKIKIYPDFTILRMPMREEVYFEHFGMMDDSDYVKNMVCKLNTYERNGIYLGINLFVTFETGKKSLNTRVLDELLKKLFLPE